LRCQNTNENYSSGNCPGLTPGSLLILFRN
jgi:hypothetical protein